MKSMNSGVSLREIHLEQFKSNTIFNSAFEVIFENYLFTEGERYEKLQELSMNRFVHLHGVTSNIGSLDALDETFFYQLKLLGKKVKAELYSDHLCWTRIDGKSTFELLPLPRTKRMVEHIGNRIDKIQNILGREFLLENISRYFSYKMDEMKEIDFMSELHDRFGVKYLLDVNNLYVNSKNFDFDADQFIQQLPITSVAAYHLGGHEDFGSFLFDTHGTRVIDPVKTLFRKAEDRFGEKPTFLERDENIPHDLNELTSELFNLSSVAQ